MMSPEQLLKMAKRMTTNKDTEYLKDRVLCEAVATVFSTLYTNLAQIGMDQEVMKREMQRVWDNLADMASVGSFAIGDTTLSMAAEMAELGADVWEREDWTTEDAKNHPNPYV